MQLRDQETGWVLWHSVKVSISSPSMVTCEASVTNRSKKEPVCVVTATLAVDPIEQVEFRFWIAPEHSETVRLERQVQEAASSLLDLVVDEF